MTQKVVIQVTVKFRDDREEQFTCCRNPIIDDWVYIYPESSQLSCRVIPKDAVASVSWDYLPADEVQPITAIISQEAMKQTKITI